MSFYTTNFWYHFYRDDDREWSRAGRRSYRNLLYMPTTNRQSSSSRRYCMRVKSKSKYPLDDSPLSAGSIPIVSFFHRQGYSWVVPMKFFNKIYISLIYFANNRIMPAHHRSKKDGSVVCVWMHRDHNACMPIFKFMKVLFQKIHHLPTHSLLLLLFVV